MQVCTSLQTDKYTTTPPLFFYKPNALPAAQPTASKAKVFGRRPKITEITTANRTQYPVTGIGESAMAKEVEL